MGRAGTGIVHIPLPGKAPRNCRRCGTLFATYKCVICMNAKSARWREKNREYMLAKRVEKAEDANLKNREYYAANKVKLLERMRAYRKAHPHVEQNYAKRNKPRILAYAKRYRTENSDKVKIANKAWRDRNVERQIEFRRRTKDQTAAKGKIYRLNNPYRSTITNNNRRAALLAAGGKLSPGLRVKLFALQKGKCACCGEPLGAKYHLDHIMPLALGGENEDRNIQLLRATCNAQKHAKHPVDFMRQRGFLL